MRKSNIRHKNQAKVLVRLTGQEEFPGVVFLSVGDRLIDLLNDDRAFIPIKRNAGGMIIIAKSQIASIIEEDGEEDHPDDEEAAPEEQDASYDEHEPVPPRQSKTIDPYTILRVNADATIEEIRSAYKARMKSVHPDSIAALGLDEDLANAALLATQKVNYAYKKIMKEREEVGKRAQKAG